MMIKQELPEPGKLAVIGEKIVFKGELT